MKCKNLIRKISAGVEKSRGEIKMLLKRATGLQILKTSTTLVDLQRLGLANYSLTYIPKYVSKATLRLNGPKKCPGKYKEKKRQMVKR